MNGGWNASTPLSAALSPLQRYSWSLAVTSGFDRAVADGGRKAVETVKLNSLRVVGEHLALAGARVDADQRQPERVAGVDPRIVRVPAVERDPLQALERRSGAGVTVMILLRALRRRLARVEQGLDREPLDAARAGRADVQLPVADGERAGARREPAARLERQVADGARAAARELAGAEVRQRRRRRRRAPARGGSSRRGRSARARRRSTPRRRTRRWAAPRRPRRSPSGCPRSRPCASAWP